MSTLPFYFVNVFAEGDYTGNRLAVFYTDKKWKVADMQALAAEARFPETAFIEPGPSGVWGLHLFTPENEIPFTGHAVLGAAEIIRNKLSDKKPRKITLTLKSGEVSVSVGKNGMLWLEQLQPVFGETLPVEVISPMLGLSPTVFHRKLPIQVVSAGLPFLVVPLNHLSDVKRARINPIKYNKLCRETEAKAVFIFSDKTYSPENQFNGRVFGQYFGVPEDAASGSANACLGGYLMHHNYFSDPEIEVRVEQGHEIGRPSLLHVRAKRLANSEAEVKVGGRVKFVAEGNWNF